MRAEPPRLATARPLTRGPCVGYEPRPEKLGRRRTHAAGRDPAATANRTAKARNTHAAARVHGPSFGPETRAAFSTGRANPDRRARRNPIQKWSPHVGPDYQAAPPACGHSTSARPGRRGAYARVRADNEAAAQIRLPLVRVWGRPQNNARG